MELELTVKMELAPRLCDYGAELRRPVWLRSWLTWCVISGICRPAGEAPSIMRVTGPR